MAKPASSADKAHWIINYDVPEDVKSATLTLAYRFWDVNVDGDVSSKRVLLEGRIKFPSAKKSVSIEVTLRAKSSQVLVDGVAVKTTSGDPGKGFRLDPSFARAPVPKLNENLAYVLAQQPVDLKKPAALGNTGEASAWIELGIDVQP